MTAAYMYTISNYKLDDVT